MAIILLLFLAASLATFFCFLLNTSLTLTASCQGVFTNQIDSVSPLETNQFSRVNCPSWRLGIETNDIIEWWTVPKECKGYVKNYLLGYQYRSDSKAVINEAINYVDTLHLPKDGRNIWIFDIDETVLSNVRHLIDQDLSGLNPALSTPEAEVLPESQRLYNKLLSVGIKVVFLTGRKENKRDPTIHNLRKTGYHIWDTLILKNDAMANKTAHEYKSTMRGNLEKQGYRIVGNIGDQWSDLLGPSGGRRLFKLPNPMYYIP